MKFPMHKYDEATWGQTSHIVRPALPDDAPTLSAIVGAVEEPALMVGPRYLDGDHGAPVRMPDRDHHYRAAFRSPVGLLGYRYTSVIELDGRVAGFVVLIPLLRLGDDLLGPLLPVEVAEARYGDLSTVVDLYLMVVDPALHDARPSIPLVQGCIAEAARLGYRYMVGQRWDRHVRSARFFEKHGGMRPFHRVEARYDETTWDAFTFIDRTLDPNAEASI